MMNKYSNISNGANLTEMDEIILNQRLKIALNEHQIADMERVISHHYDGNSLTRRMVIRIAAVLVMIISVPVILSYLQNTGDKGIFKDYFAPYSHQNVTGVYRGQESGKNAPILLYSAGNYSFALPKLRLYLNENPADLQVRLLLAICLIEEKKFNEAELELTEILVASDFYFRDDALWYLALLSVRKGDFEKANKFLGPIKTDKVYGPMVQSLGKVISPQK
jgi:tetratricopeptide (TPR) repeat protein